MWYCVSQSKHVLITRNIASKETLTINNYDCKDTERIISAASCGTFHNQLTLLNLLKDTEEPKKPGQINDVRIKHDHIPRLISMSLNFV